MRERFLGRKNIILDVKPSPKTQKSSTPINLKRVTKFVK